MVTRRNGMITLAALLVCAFAFFVWPTLYRDAELPNKLRTDDALCCYGARANRFTSEVQVLTALEGWQPLSLTKGDSVAKATAALLLK